MKFCSKCKKKKAAEEFRVDERLRAGRRAQCKECDQLSSRVWHKATYNKRAEKKRVYGRARYEANKDKILASVAAYQKSNPGKIRAAKLKRASRYKADWMKIIEACGMDRCSKCGYCHSFAAIEFHHKDPKEKEENVSRLMEWKPTPERIRELNKCVALCANCHRELHFSGVV